eukprot:jgi/Botrbrau1/15803/Bobra.4_1s0153.1
MPRNTSSTASALDRPNMGAWIKFLRLLFRLINILLAFIGLGMLAYTVDIFIKYRATKHDVPTQSAVTRTLQEVPQLSAPATGSWHFRGGLNRQGILTAHDWLAGGKNSARRSSTGGPRDNRNHGDPHSSWGPARLFCSNPSTQVAVRGPFSIFKRACANPPNPDPPSPYPAIPDPPTPDPPIARTAIPGTRRPQTHPSQIHHLRIRQKPEPKTKPPPPPPPKPPQVHFLW